MEKNLISSLRNIGDLLNHEMLNKLGWNNLEENTSLPGLEVGDIYSCNTAIDMHEYKIEYLRFSRGLACLEQGDPESALEDFKYLQELEALDMTRSKWAFFMGIAYIGIGKSWEAISEIGTYAKENGKSFDTNFWMGHAYYKMKYFSAALKYLVSAIKEDPSAEEPHFLRGKINIAKKAYKDAEKDFLKVLELNPEHKKAKYYLNIVYEIIDNLQRFMGILD